MKNLDELKTINELKTGEIDISLKDYSYQSNLTIRLEQLSEDFTQEIINEFVLWKVNRYFKMDDETLNLLNSIDRFEKTIDVKLTKNLLSRMLVIPGIRLPMASTILRFKNPNIYQIIDQRAYRFLKGEELKTYFSTIDQQTEYYLNYLVDLRIECSHKGIPFEKADQILYQLDKEINKKYKIKT